MGDSVRKATIANTSVSIETVRAYMPHNYGARLTDDGTIEIIGEDYAGWTLDGYVIPRLASGMIFAQEVTGE